LDGHRKVGIPGEILKKYRVEGAVEILYMDVVASLFGRSDIFSLVAEAAKKYASQFVTKTRLVFNFTQKKTALRALHY